MGRKEVNSTTSTKAELSLSESTDHMDERRAGEQVLVYGREGRKEKS